MTNSLVGDHQVVVVDVDEGDLEGSLTLLGHIWMDSLWKIGKKYIYYVKLNRTTNSLVGEHQVAAVDVVGIPEGGKSRDFF